MSRPFYLSLTGPDGQFYRTPTLHFPSRQYTQCGYVWNSWGDRQVAAQPVQDLGPRNRREPERYSSCGWTPGSNNGYTTGRKVDSYDRGYNGSNR